MAEYFFRIRLRTVLGISVNELRQITDKSEGLRHLLNSSY